MSVTDVTHTQWEICNSTFPITFTMEHVTEFLCVYIIGQACSVARLRKLNFALIVWRLFKYISLFKNENFLNSPLARHKRSLRSRT